MLLKMFWGDHIIPWASTLYLGTLTYLDNKGAFFIRVPNFTRSES